jgi:hypothetical protein
MPVNPGPADVEILNAAFKLIGEEPLQSIDSETPAAAATVALWGRLVDFALGFYPWSFATRTMALTRTADATNDGWLYSYQMPAERIGPPIAVAPRRDFRIPFTDYCLIEDRLHTDAETIWAQLHFRAAAGAWSGAFTFAFTTALAGELALAITSDQKLRDTLRTDAWGPATAMGRGGLMGLAIQVDARAQPSPVLLADGGPLVTARMGGLWTDT